MVKSLRVIKELPFSSRTRPRSLFFTVIIRRISSKSIRRNINRFVFETRVVRVFSVKTSQNESDGWESRAACIVNFSKNISAYQLDSDDLPI